MKMTVKGAVGPEEYCVAPLKTSLGAVTEVPKCSFLGIPADYYIGFAEKNEIINVRIVGAVCAQMVEKAIVNLLGQGSGEMRWPVILDLEKKMCYHSYEAHKKEISAIMGWKDHLARRNTLV
jgi:hypothetical protein